MTVDRDLHFFYDFSSPFSYLGATQVERLAAEHDVKVRWRPMLLGAIFKQIGTPMVPVETFSEPKRVHSRRDLHRWANHWQVPLHWPSRFPMRTVAPLRLALVAGPQIAPLSLAIYRAFWVDDRDISDRGVLAAILNECGLDSALLERIDEPAIKQMLIDATEQAAAAGVCGAPCFQVRGHLFWGQDRIDLVSRTLGGWEPPI